MVSPVISTCNYMPTMLIILCLYQQAVLILVKVDKDVLLVVLTTSRRTSSGTLREWLQRAEAAE